MKKVYFDQNVTSCLKDKENKDKLDKILESKKNEYNYFYSYAHFNDLLSADPNWIYIELEIIQRITDGNILVKTNDYKIKKIKQNAILYYNQIIQNKNINAYDNIFDEKELKKFIDDKFKKYSENYRQKMYMDALNELEIIKDNEKFDVYRYKKLIPENMNINDFINVVNDKLEIYKNSNNFNLLTLINIIHDNIDMLDYKDIKDRKKTRYKNTMIDSLHYFFSTYCNYFITDDLTLKNKVSLIFNIINDYFIDDLKNYHILKDKINTKVMKLVDFVNLI